MHRVDDLPERGMELGRKEINCINTVISKGILLFAHFSSLARTDPQM